MAYVCTVDVTSMDDHVRAVESNGGTIVVPKVPIPGLGWLVYARDTGGNIFGAMQADPGARREHGSAPR